MAWLVFSYSLPAQARSSPRVTVWRRLKQIGALAVAGGAQVLPARGECEEAFQWLAQEIRQAQGEAVTMPKSEQSTGLADAELIALFQAARAADYAELEAISNSWSRRSSQKTASGCPRVRPSTWTRSARSHASRRCSTCSTRTRGSTRSAARRPSPAWNGGRSTRSTCRCWCTNESSSCCAASRSCPRSSSWRASTARPTRSRPGCESSPTGSTASTTTATCSAMCRPSSPRPGCGWSKVRGPDIAIGLDLLGVSAPEAM